jgi:hypothetical protein
MNTVWFICLSDLLETAFLLIKKNANVMITFVKKINKKPVLQYMEYYNQKYVTTTFTL